jgi:galactokinase
MDSLFNKTRGLFVNAFGREPEVLALAPGRVEILGNHTDYNEGVVLSAAIDRHIAVAAAKGADALVSAWSSAFPGIVSVTQAQPRQQETWVNYSLGVYAMLKRAGYPVGPFRIAIHSDIPMGAGLSSSAALEVATGLALSQLFGFTVDPKELGRYCKKAEHEFCGAKCGLLDQFSVLFGRKDQLLYIDFRSLDYRTIPLPSSSIELCITPSGVTHALSDSAYNDRRRECFSVAEHFASFDKSVTMLRDIGPDRLESEKSRLDPVAYRRARHVIGENERVRSGIELLARGDLDNFGKLLYDSHESSRVDFENSCRELDILVGIAREIGGVYGSRLSGGGFGGATVAVIDPAARSRFENDVPIRYRQLTGRTTSVHVASIADGASAVSL